MHELLKAWRDWECGSPPFLLSEDEKVLNPHSPRARSVVYSSWDCFAKDRDFGKSGDKRFHLDLIPVPFTGDLCRAKVVILLLNPGLDPADYYGEFQVPGFRDRIIKNLKQDFRNTEYPFLYLDPAFSWHSGYRWWHGKFQRIIVEISKSRNISYAEARCYLSKVLASVELVPYHSFTYGLSKSRRQQLRSANLACDYVNDVLVPRSKAGDVLVVVTRQGGTWGLVESKHVVIYSGAKTRASHLTPTSDGGKRILEFFL